MNMRIIDDLTKFIFVEDSLTKVDAIMLPGGSFPQLAIRAAQLWMYGYAKYIVPSGGVHVNAGKYDCNHMSVNGPRSKEMTECEYSSRILARCGVYNECVIGENQSSCIAENAQYTRKLLDFYQLEPKKAMICCKAYHSRRCLMFYQHYFPKTEFIMIPVDDVQGDDITKSNWYKTDIGRSIIFNELTKVGIQFTQEFQSLVHENNICELLSVGL